MAQLSISSSGTTFLSGTVSGIDTQSLIQNAVNVKLLPRKRIDDTVSANTNKITAYQSLQTQANALKAAFAKLQTDPVLGNVFAGRQATYTSSNPSITPASVLSATVTSSALSGNHTVIVNSTAKAFAAQATLSQSSTSTALGFSGSFDIGEAGKTATTINVTSSSTLQDIANAINATTATSGTSADILQTSPGQYQLVIRGADTAKAVTVSNITGTNVLQNLGVTNGAGAFTNITQPPTQASITLDGSTVLSDSNKFSNVLSGLTIDVVSAAPGTTINVTVGNDTAGVKAAIQGVIDTYNTLKTNIDALKKVGDDGTVDPKAYLFNENLNTSLANNIRSLVTGSYGSSSSYNGLSSLGITLDADGKLVMDSSKLDTALANNFNDVMAVFATNTKFSAYSDLQSSATSGLGLTGSFKIGEAGKTAATINVTGSTTLTGLRDAINATSGTTGVTASISQLSSGEFRITISGTTDSAAVQVTSITGTDVLTSLGLTSSAGTFTNNTSTVGLANTATNILDSFGNTSSGSLANAINGLTSTNATLKTKSDAIKTQVDAYQLQLINKYAKLEALIQGANTVKAQIKAILTGTSGNN
jgi:flagellar hook-associated protein 2